MSQPANQPGHPARASRQTKPGQPIQQPRRLPPYNVILLNDDDHTYEYVIEMLSTLFGYNPAKGYLMAEQLNPKGRVIVLTTHKEHAEFKRDQIHAFGRDQRIDHCAGSMSAVIEPAC